MRRSSTFSPTKPPVHDTFLYQGFVGTPSDAFFNFGNLGDQTPYKNILGVSKTTTAPNIHNTVSLLQFDLSSLSAYTDSDIISATLTLQATPGLGFYEDPSSSWPVTIDAYANHRHLDRIGRHVGDAADGRRFGLYLASGQRHQRRNFFRHHAVGQRLEERRM